MQPAPLYILDEIDAALDLSHTQRIGRFATAEYWLRRFVSVGSFLGEMIRTQFSRSQFIVVSLKENLFNYADVLFRYVYTQIEYADTISIVIHSACINTLSQYILPKRHFMRNAPV